MTAWWRQGAARGKKDKGGGRGYTSYEEEEFDIDVDPVLDSGPDMRQ